MMEQQMEHQVPQVHEAAHPTPARYIAIAVILTAVTAIEVAVYYMEALRGMLVPILLTFSALKFALVVMFYMHLRFDARLFSTFFVGGLMLGAGVMIALMALMAAL
jgi:caa(3)-type oxidase subunit IV